MKTLGRATPTSDAGRLDPLLTQPNTYTTAAVAISATSMTSNRIPNNVLISGQGWIVIDAGTTEAEARKITAVAGNKVTWSGGLTYAHAAGDAVMFVDKPVLNVKWWGATGDGSTDDATAINLCAAQAYALGSLTAYTNFGELYFPAGTYMVGTSIVIYPFVRYVGTERGTVTLKLAASANTDVMITQNFAYHSNTGSANGGVDYTNDSVPCLFTLENFLIDGNKASNATSGYGIKIYGYHYRLINVEIINCREIGYYSEMEGGSTYPDWVDRPPADIYGLRINQCEQEGILFRGPRDSMLDEIRVSQCCKTSGFGGITLDQDDAYGGGGRYYSGISDWGKVHTFAHGSYVSPYNHFACGWYVKGSARARVGELISETNRGANVVIGQDSDHNQISLLRLYKSGESGLMTGWTTATKGFHYNGSTYTALGTAYDDNVGTTSNLTLLAAGHYLYWACSNWFNAIKFDLTNVNNNTATITVEYYNGTAWTAVNKLRDTCDVSGAPFAQDGELWWDFPDDYSTVAVNSETRRWIRISTDVDLDQVGFTEVDMLYRRYGIEVRGEYDQIVNSYISEENGNVGMALSGGYSKITNLVVRGDSTAGYGLWVESDGNDICGGELTDFSATGGVGLLTNQDGEYNRNLIRLHVRNNKTGWSHAVASNRAHYELSINALTGQTLKTGVGNTNHNDTWLVDTYDTDTAARSLSRPSGSATVANGTTSIAVTHGCVVTPSTQDVLVTPTADLGSASKFWVSGVGATQFTINVDVDPGGDVTFNWQVQI